MSYDCYCDYEPATLYSARVHQSRKDRRCEECGRQILKGTKYERVDGLYDGHWFHAFTCEPCLELRQWVKNSVPCFCWEPGNMIDAAKEAVEDYKNYSMKRDLEEAKRDARDAPPSHWMPLPGKPEAS